MRPTDALFIQSSGTTVGDPFGSHVPRRQSQRSRARRAPPRHLRASSSKLLPVAQTSQHYRHHGRPLQAHRSHLAPPPVPAAPAHPAIHHPPPTRRLLHHPQNPGHRAYLPRQPDPPAHAQEHHPDRRHGARSLEPAIPRRESSTNDAAVVQLHHRRRGPHRNRMSYKSYPAKSWY
jgi:hypothetical protein